MRHMIEIPQLKLGSIQGYSQFSKPHVLQKILKDNKHNSLHLVQK